MRAVIGAWILAVGCGRFHFELHDDGGADGAVDADPTAFTFVQSNDVGTNLMLNQLALAFTQPVTAGDLLVAEIDYQNPGGLTIQSLTDTEGNGFSGVGPYDGGGPNRQYLWFAIADASSTDAVTVILSGNAGAYFELRVLEYAGVAASNIVDAESGSSGTTNAIDGAQTTLTTSAANDLVLAAATYQGRGSAGTGFTLRDAFHDDVIEDMVAATPGMYTATTTMYLGTQWTITAVALRHR